MPRKKAKARSEWGLYGACIVCGAPFLVRESDGDEPPEVRQSCLCMPMAVFAAQMGEHFHIHRDA